MRNRSLHRSASLWIALPLLLHPVAAAGAERMEQALQPLLLSATVNGAAGGEPQLFVKDATGKIYLSESFLRQWKLRLPTGQTITFEGERFFALDASLPLKAEFAEADQSIVLDARPELFERQQAALRSYDRMEMTKPANGFFMNYDLLAERTNSGTGASGAVELGIFSRFGVAASGFVGSANSSEQRLTRLDTNWVADRPASMTSLRIGDGISSGTASAPPVRFAGIQYATSFATQPGFVTTPLGNVSGSAALPSVIDVFVNGVLQGSREITPGPFDVTGVPLQSGGGNIQIVVRDLLGRQVVSDQNYYSSNQLLTRGLSEFSYEAGFLRHHFGTRSFDYGAPMASATHRHGVSDSLTIAGVAQISRSTRVVGAGATAVVSQLGLASGSVNFSHSAAGSGRNFSFSLERRVDGPSFGARADFSSRHYLPLGRFHGEASTRSDAQLFADVPLPRGTIGLSYIRRDYHADGLGKRRPAESLAGLFASANLGRLGSLQIFARRSSVGSGRTVLGTHLAVAFGAGRTGTASAEYRRGQRQATFSTQQSLPMGQGFGYRSSFSFGDTRRAEATALLNTAATSLTLEAARGGGTSGLRLSAKGALGVIGNTGFASRQIGDSFAAVKVGRMKNVRVYADNQLIGTTDKAGTLIIPTMRAYERNSIRLDAGDLPLDVQIETTEQAVRPFARAGTVIRFSARVERGAVLQIALEDGAPLPAGALVFIDQGKEGYVTVPGGEVYVPNLSGRTELKARWNGRSCSVRVDVPSNDDPQPRVEGLVCRAVTSFAAK